MGRLGFNFLRLKERKKDAEAAGGQQAEKSESVELNEFIQVVEEKNSKIRSIRLLLIASLTLTIILGAYIAFTKPRVLRSNGNEEAEDCPGIHKVNAIRIWCGVDFCLCGENIVGSLFTVVVLLKYYVTIFSEAKIMTVHERVAVNWITITDADERSILIDYAKSGKMLSIIYIVYSLTTGLAFSQVTILPVVLDKLFPMNESRQKILIVRAEYHFIDPFEYYYELYIGYCVAGIISGFVLTSIDTTFSTVVLQNLGILSIVKFVDIIESSYCYSILVLIGCFVFALSLGVVIIIEYLDQKIEVLRFTLMALGVLMLMFYLTYPGQQLLDHSSNIFTYIYMNKWYFASQKAKTLLRIMMLRCLKPSVLTAGKLYILNYQNYGSIIRTTLSYITVVASMKN